MAMETYILEDTRQMDLGDTRKAFDDYPGVKDALLQKRDEYRSLVNRLKSNPPSRITREEEKRADDLYDKVKGLKQTWLDLHASLSDKFEALLLESKKNAAELTNCSNKLVDEDDAAWGKSLLVEALALKDSNELVDAVQKVYQAGECMRGLLARAKGVWLKKHQANIEAFSVSELL